MHRKQTLTFNSLRSPHFIYLNNFSFFSPLFLSPLYPLFFLSSISRPSNPARISPHLPSCPLSLLFLFLSSLFFSSSLLISFFFVSCFFLFNFSLFPSSTLSLLSFSLFPLFFFSSPLFLYPSSLFSFSHLLSPSLPLLFYFPSFSLSSPHPLFSSSSCFISKFFLFFFSLLLFPTPSLLLLFPFPFLFYPSLSFHPYSSHFPHSPLFSFGHRLSLPLSLSHTSPLLFLLPFLLSFFNLPFPSPSPSFSLPLLHISQFFVSPLILSLLPSIIFHPQSPYQAGSITPLPPPPPLLLPCYFSLSFYFHFSPLQSTLLLFTLSLFPFLYYFLAKILWL